jgi:hypothetical protein
MRYSQWYTPDDEIATSHFKKICDDAATHIEWNLEVRSAYLGCGTHRMGELRIHGDLTGQLTIAIIDEITMNWESTP